MHILIENFLPDKLITLFGVCDLLFTKKLTFYNLAILNLVYRMLMRCIFICMFFSVTINGEPYQIIHLIFSGKICQQHQENVNFIA